jgi:hypothetical protein
MSMLDDFINGPSLEDANPPASPVSPTRELSEAKAMIERLTRQVAMLQKDLDAKEKTEETLSETSEKSEIVTAMELGRMQSQARKAHRDNTPIFDVGFIFCDAIAEPQVKDMIEALTLANVTSVFLGSPQIISRDTGEAATNSQYDIARINEHNEVAVHKALGSHDITQITADAGVDMRVRPMTNGFDPRTSACVEHIDHWLRKGCGAVGPVSILDYDHSFCINGDPIGLCSEAIEQVCGTCVKHGKPLLVKLDALVLGKDGLRPCSTTLVDLDTVLMAFPTLTLVCIPPASAA